MIGAKLFIKALFWAQRQWALLVTHRFSGFCQFCGSFVTQVQQKLTCKIRGHPPWLIRGTTKTFQQLIDVHTQIGVHFWSFSWHGSWHAPLLPGYINTDNQRHSCFPGTLRSFHVCWFAIIKCVKSILSCKSIHKTVRSQMLLNANAAEVGLPFFYGARLQYLGVFFTKR